ncbi:MAG: 6-phosphofructokinase [Candidatus Omnitrophica bacterium]|nr:6-phosphofructokinase [Candidatus Omnitrophota bacterium]
MKRIGILTGGGDCPGLNPVIRAVVMKGIKLGYEIVGIKDGWKGLVEGSTIPLNEKSVLDILAKGGTILGTSRTNPYKDLKQKDRAIANFKKLKLYALIVIGGEDTLGVANKLNKEGLRVVGVPKTIDNDLNATDFTFGFDTAVNIATDCIDRLRTTAESHHRVMVCEVMGRHAGWIAVYSGLAGAADVVLIPEERIDINEVCKILRRSRKKRKGYSIVVVSEGAQLKKGDMVLQEKELDAFGHVRLGGIGNQLSEMIEARTGFETRVVVLGHMQRGGTPTVMDRVLGTRFGIAAIDLAHKKKFGHMVCLSGNQIKSVPLSRAVAKLKTVDKKLYDIAKLFFG